MPGLWDIAYRGVALLLNRIHCLPVLLVLLFAGGLVHDPGILLILAGGVALGWVALRWRRVREPVAGLLRRAGRVRLFRGAAWLARGLVAVLAIVLTLLSLAVLSAFLFSDLCAAILLSMSLALWVVLVPARSWRYQRVAAVSALLVAWAASFVYLAARFTLLYDPVADTLLVILVASPLAVVAVCIHMLVHRRPLERLVTHRWGAWASTSYLLMFTQIFAFGLTYDTSSVPAILRQAGVSSIATYEGATEFKRRTGLVVNLVTEACRKDRYLVGYFMTSGGLPTIALDALTGEVTPLPVVGDSSESFLNLCARNRVLVGSANRLVLLEDRDRDYVIRDEVAFDGGQDYVRRVTADPVTDRAWVSVWNPRAGRGVVHQVTIADSRIVLGAPLEAGLFVPWGDTAFTLKDGMLQKLQDGRVVAETRRGDSPKFTRLAYSAQHDLLYLINGVGGFFSGTMEIIDARTLQRRKTVELRKGIRFFGYNRRYDLLLVANYTTGELYVVDPVGGGLLQTLQFSGRLRTIQFSDDEERALVVCAAGLFRIDMATVARTANRPPALP